MSLCEDSDSNYKKFAQIKVAINNLRHKPTYFLNLLKFNEDFDINYRIPESFFIKSNRPHKIGTTLLNVALDAGEDRIFKILVDRGASFTDLSSDGLTVVHAAVGENFKYQLSFLKPYGSTSNSDFANIALSAHVDRDISTNPRNSYGVTHFHIASMINHKEAVEYFLKNGVKVDEAVHENSPVFPGFTALHFAAMFASYETAEILLNHGADANLKDVRGMSALHILVEERLRYFPAVFRDNISLWGKQTLNNYYSRNEKLLMLFLKKMTSNVDDIGLSHLHVTCTLQDSSTVKKLLSESDVNIHLQIKSDSVIRPGYTALHFAAAVCNEEAFAFLLLKGAKMEINDVHGICPFDLCLLSFKISSIHNILSCHSTWKEIVFSDGRTKLLDFIGAMRKSEDFHSFLKGTDMDVNMFVPLDSPICAGYTPLHLCCICSEKPPNSEDPRDEAYPNKHFVSYNPMKTTLYGKRLEQCLVKGANICTQDARGSTPLHWAFRLQESFLVDLLLGHHKQLDNPTNDDGLSHLHIASAAGYGNVVRKLLLNNRADVKSQVKKNYSWYRCHRRFDAKSGSTPLHFAGVVKHLKMMEILLEGDADELAVDDDNCNPMDIVLDAGGRGAQLPVETRLSYSEPYKLLLPNTLKLLSYNESKLRDKVLNKLGLTRLYAACIMSYDTAVRKLLQRDGVDVDERVDGKSADWSGMTPLFCYVVGRYLRSNGNDFPIAEMLLEHGADVMKIRCGGTVIHRAFELHCYKRINFGVKVPDEFYRNDLRLLKLLLNSQRDFSVNPTTSSGLSHLHIACACNDLGMVMKFLKHGVDVNQKIDYFCDEYGGCSPLHIAAIYKSNETVDVLLKNGADVHSTNSFNDTPLHVAMKTPFQNLFIMEALLRAGADVNAQNTSGATPVEYLIQHNECKWEEIEMCLKNGCKVNLLNPVTEEGCLGQAFNHQLNSELFYKMIVESTDLTRPDGRDRNAIHSVVSVIFDRHDKEHKIPIPGYTKAIEDLMKFNLDIDQQDSEGKTPLHYATRMGNWIAVVGLLNNGADINISDESGKTAYEYCATFKDATMPPRGNVPDHVLDVFTSHASKLASQNLDINASIRKLLEQDENRILVRLKAGKRRRELMRLSIERIESCSLSLGDFLSETSAIVNLPRLPFNQRDAVEEFFANKIEYLRENYPDFAGILILQHRKALKRAKMIPIALDSVSVLVGFNMPYVCSNTILQFLSNKNLNNLIKAAFPWKQ